MSTAEVISSHHLANVKDTASPWQTGWEFAPFPSTHTPKRGCKITLFLPPSLKCLEMMGAIQWTSVKVTSKPCNMLGPQATNYRQRSRGLTAVQFPTPSPVRPSVPSPGVEADFVSTPIHYHGLYILLCVADLGRWKKFNPGHHFSCYNCSSQIKARDHTQQLQREKLYLIWDFCVIPLQTFTYIFNEYGWREYQFLKPILLLV